MYLHNRRLPLAPMANWATAQGARTIAVFYSPNLGGSWHVHNTKMDPGPNRRLLHVFIGDPKQDLKDAVVASGHIWAHIPWRSRRHLPGAVLKARRLIRQHGVDVVHGHGIEGTLTSLLAATLTGVHERIHTRHHGTMHHEVGPRRALLADRLVNRLSTRIIATCSGVRKSLLDLEGVSPAKIRVLEYRLGIEEFDDVLDERVSAVRQRHDINPDRTVVGLISRLVWWKGVEFAVAAFTDLLEPDPSALLVIAGGTGPHSTTVEPLLRALPADSVRIIDHEQDIAALYKTFDVCVHLPVTAGVEAWGQVYVESMAAGVPLVCTRSGIGVDLLENGQNCLIVDYRNAEEVSQALETVLGDRELADQLVHSGRRDIARYARTPDLNTFDAIYC